MAKTFTIQDFFQKFPDNNACLEHLMLTRYGESLDCPHCGKHSKFSKHSKRPVYQCQWCGHQISPMAGTPFAKSRTALTKWFYAMYLFTTSRHGVPAKELQRQLGVTYKCAWRMGHEIRKYMSNVDGDSGLSGHVEMDETYVGGREKNARGRPSKNSKKTAIFGMVERNGDVITRVIPNASKAVLIPIIKEHVTEGSEISTDDWNSYNKLHEHGYKHGIVKHQLNQWVNGINHTQTIEGFWSQIKRSIRGTHIHVSKKHMAKYLGEFEYRYNMRSNPSLMFDRLLASF